MQPARAWIGLGGNREDSTALLDEALANLSGTGGVRLLRRSRKYTSQPWGVLDQPDFVNAVAELETTMLPLPLLRLLQAIEDSLGRDRTASRWGPRCIDLDLLTYDAVRIESENLVLPHPRMHVRAFVLVPLLELEPEFVIPGAGRAADCLQQIDPGEIAAVLPRPRFAEEQRP